MEFLTLVLLLSSILVFLTVLRSKSFFGRSKKYPPGPPPIPYIGNLHQIGQDPPRTLAKLAKIYGPLMHLKLGSVHVVVASSPEAAKELLQTHDQVCSGRLVPCVSGAMDHDKGSFVMYPTTVPKWRKCRKFIEEEIFRKQKMDERGGIREEKVQQLLDYFRECRSSGKVVDIGQVAIATVLNVFCSTLFSTDFGHFDSDSAREMKETIEGLMKTIGTPNLADYFPILRPFDPQGLKRRMGENFGKVLGFFDKIIDKRLQSREACSDCGEKKDVLDALLDLNQDGESAFSRHEMKHLILDIFIEGIDTITVTFVWGMTELLRNPGKMRKLKDELRTIVGENERVKESDIPKLPYLNAVVKETFRCHPAGPLLFPHKAEADVEINGYFIPKDAQLFVNAWAIGRDPSVWPNPDSFEPERFLGSKIDYKGRDFELIPFGSGRRVCPGMPLASVMVHFMMASFVHGFEWKLEKEELDMNEVAGFSPHKVVPLKAFVVK